MADNDPPGTPARRSALKLLDAVLRRGQPLESALGPATQILERADDRAFAHAIAAETLRRLPDLDALIDSATKTALPDDAKARMVLRIALVQALALNTPAHAAIATVLPLVDGGPKRLVHGVFGTLTRAAPTLPSPPHLPAPVVDRWRPAWGGAVVEAARGDIAAPPPIDLTLADPAYADALGGVVLAPGHVRLPAGTSVPDLPGYAAGGWWVQDLSSSLPARLLGDGNGRRIADLCAAPGGKTMQLAANGWRVTALDLSEKRLDRLRTNLKRNHLSAEIVTGNAAVWEPAEPLDAVLLDAPCTATGTFRRHPEVLHRVRDRAIAELAERQAQLLAHATTLVRPGGTLVYAVCSLERAEGEDIALALSHPDFTIQPVAAHELPDGITPDANGFVRMLPGMMAAAGGIDGFFVARWVRKA